MIVKKLNGQICKECGQFSKKFIICEVCRKKLCLECAGSVNFCPEHLLKSKRTSLIDDYFIEKYGCTNEI